MARLINDSGVLGDTVTVTASNINRVSFDKIVEAINVTQERMGIMGTTANEASTTIQGSINTMKGAWENLKVAMVSDTGDIDQRINEFVESVGTVGENLLPRIKTALSGIVTLVKKLAPDIIAELPGLVQTLLPEVLSAAMSLVGTLADTLLNGGTETLWDVGLDMIMMLLNGLLSALTDGQAVQKIVQLVIDLALRLTDPDTLVPLLEAALDIILALANGLIQAIPELVKAIPTITANIISTFLEILPKMRESGNSMLQSLKDAFTLEDTKEYFSSVWEGIKTVFGSVGTFFSDTFGNAWQSVKDVFTKGGAVFEGITDSIGDFFKTTINHIIDGFNSVMYKPFEGINDVIEKIKGIDIFGAKPFGGLNTITIPQIPKLFKGGVLERGQIGLLEGNGAEAVVPLENNKKWISAVAKDMSFAISNIPQKESSVINNYITINGAQYNSEESIAEAVAYKIQQMINGKGEAYA